MAARQRSVVLCAGALAVLLVGLGPASPATAAPTGPRDLTFFLHYVNATEAAKPLPGAGSTWTYFDTSTEWNDENATLLANGSLQSFDWYLAPAFAGNVSVTGASLAFWAQAVSGVPSAQTTVELSERAASGAETLISTGNFGSETYTSSPGLKRLNWTFSGAHTFAAGSSVKLSLKLNIGGGSLLILYDTARADSRLSLTSANALAIAGAQVLDFAGTPAASLDPAAANLTARLRATVQDPYGGYDVAWVQITVLNETGVPVLDNATASRISGTPASFASTYEALWNYSMLPGGRYVVIVAAMDNSGESHYTHFGNFIYGPYGDSFSFPAFIGGLPLHAWVRVVDDRQVPLEGARVTLTESPLRGGEATTDAAGLVNLTAGPGLYTVAVTWTQVEVARFALNLSDNITAAAPFEVRAAVFYPSLQLVDNQSAPLTDAAITYTHPNGTTTLAPLITSTDGTINLGRTAAGAYHVLARWGTLVVLDSVWAVNASAATTFRAAVFYVEFRVLDSRGAGVAFATLVARDSSTGVVLAFALTDSDGRAQARLPGALVDVDVWTRDIQVVDRRGLLIGADGPVDLAAAVYYLTVAVADSQSNPVEGARVTVRSSGGTVTETALTGASGNTSIRLPVSLYSVAVEWFGDLVASVDAVNVTADVDVPLVVSVYSLQVTVVDSRQVPLSALTIAVRTLDGSNDTVALGLTGQDGRASFHLPRGNFSIEGVWKNTSVVDATVEVAGDSDVSLSARVGYLTVHVVDREGRALNEAIVSVLPQAHDGGLLVEYTGTNGTASFRLARGNYTVTSRLIATYLLSPIDQTIVQPISVGGQDAEVTVVMTDFQPAFVATNAFAIGLLFLLAMAGFAAFVYLRYQRPDRPDEDDEEAVAAEEPKKAP